MFQCSRILLSLLHCLVFIDSAFVFIYSLVTRESHDKCFPQLVQADGSVIPFESKFGYLCDGIIYSTASVCALHILMCFFINCGWKNKAVIILNLITTLLTALTSVFGGAIFTFYNILWCNSVNNWAPPYVSNDCDSAIQEYDERFRTNNMTTYIRRLEFQQISVWTVVPLAFVTLVIYSLSLLVREPRSPEPQVHHVVFPDERSPLLVNSRHERSDAENLVTRSRNECDSTCSTEIGSSRPT